MIRPTLYDFPHDARCFEENDEMMLGGKLLVASVVEPGQQDRAVYLPQGCAWMDFWTGQRFEGGQSVTLPAPWDKPPLLVREGSIVPLNVAEQHFAQPADERGFAVFPHAGAGEFSDEFFEDDGISNDYRRQDFGLWKIGVTAHAASLSVAIVRAGSRPPTAIEVTLLFPVGETRPVQAGSALILADRIDDGWRQVRLLPAPAENSSTR
jgi:alpha-glucosidase